MKRILLPILLIFSYFAFSQDGLNINDVYLHELITQSDEKSIINFDTESIDSRKATIEKITSHSYQDPSFLKMAMVLHMLKYRLGDEDYKNSVDEYLLDLNMYNQTATIEGLKETIENQTGKDLSDFFDDWFYGKGFPSYEVSWFQNKTTNVISLAVNQYQSDDIVTFFEMPLPIKVTSEDGQSQFIRLELSQDKQSFNGVIPFIIKTVEIDPEYQLISKNNILKEGVDQEILNTSISLYPNPVKNLLNIQNSGDAIVEKVSIYDMLGKLIMQENNPLLAINLRPLSFGIHLVKIETSQGTLHKTILKEQ